MGLKFLENKIKERNKRILFTECDDKRIKKAVNLIEKKKLAEIVLLKEGSIEEKLKTGVELLKSNKIDGIISGATHPSALTIKTAFNFKKGLVSSFFLILWKNKKYLFADCAVIPDPNYEQLAEIAIQTAESAKLFNIKPKIAMLSYSTKGSAKDGTLEKIRKATEIIKKKTDLIIDGELQLDAAIIPKIAKAKNSNIIKGDANILIFPDLNAGNIGYKLAERFGNAIAVGPILQNLSKPVNDLSRGASVEEIYNVALVTILQAQR